MKSTLIAAVALLALTGCASSTPKPAAAKPSPTPSTATITQYASAMNGPLTGFKKSWDDYREQCLVEQNDFACQVDMVTLNASAETIKVVVSGSGTAVGPPPGELVALLNRTYMDADVVAADTAEGSGTKDNLFGDGTALAGDIDAWGPYLS